MRERSSPRASKGSHRDLLWPSHGESPKAAAEVDDGPRRSPGSNVRPKGVAPLAKPRSPRANFAGTEDGHLQVNRS